MKRLLIVGLVVLAIMAIGSWLVLEPRWTRTRALHEAEARWKACGIADYTWTQTAGAFMVGPAAVEIEVRDGRAVSATSGGEPVALGKLPGHPRTVEESFRWIESWVGSDGFEATYDATCGYPVHVQVDPQRNAMDDEYGITVRELQPLTQ